MGGIGARVEPGESLIHEQRSISPGQSYNRETSDFMGHQRNLSMLNMKVWCQKIKHGRSHRRLWRFWQVVSYDRPLEVLYGHNSWSRPRGSFSAIIFHGMLFLRCVRCKITSRHRRVLRGCATSMFRSSQSMLQQYACLDCSTLCAKDGSDEGCRPPAVQVCRCREWPSVEGNLHEPQPQIERQSSSVSRLAALYLCDFSSGFSSLLGLLVK